jgi:tetratricopeptide (TPR) repeat protein
MLHTIQGRYQQALACQRHGLAINRELQDRHQSANNLINLGVVHQRQGRFQEALSCLEEALGLHREIGDRQGQAETLQELGILRRRQGQTAASHDCLQESLAINRELGEPKGHADSLRELGLTLLDLGHPDQARADWLHALTIFERLGATTAADQVRTLLGATPGPAVAPMGKSSSVPK